MNELREEVRRRYAESALAVISGDARSCCPDKDTGASFGSGLYEAEQRGDLPEAAVLASLGCGNPTAVAELREGETVLDLGSGGGIDVILSARRVGETGRAYGLDMTDEMLELAQRNAEEAGVHNAVFLKGHMEEIPLPAGSVDVVISNCVINLSVDKQAVLSEIGRVLKPGGRVGVSDVVAEDRLSPDDRAERGSYCGCIAGALSKGEYEAGLAAAGLEDVSRRVHARGCRRHARRDRQGAKAGVGSDSVRAAGYRACDMPQWIALLAIVVVAWMVLAVVGGWLIGRGLGAIERRAARTSPTPSPVPPRPKIAPWQQNPPSSGRSRG